MSRIEPCCQHQQVHFWTHGGIGAKGVSPTHPLTMGHEASGVVHSTGSAVTSLRPGDRVAIEPGFPCRRCKACKSGRYNLCQSVEFAAAPSPDHLSDVHGTLCKFYTAPEDFCYKIPADVSLEEAVLVEPLGVAVHVVRLADVRPGQEVVVMGSGTIGLLCAAVAEAFGASKIVVVDVLDRKLEFASGFIDCETFKPDTAASAEDNAARLLREHKFGEGVDSVLECSGAESSMQTGIHVLRLGGTYVQAGVGKPYQMAPILAMSEKEVIFKGCFRYSSGDYELALSLLKRKRVSVKELISSMVPFERAAEAWERTKRGEGIKNLIRGVED